MATFDQFIASLRTEFGEQGAGKPFEVFCKWFLENDPEWSKTVDKVWLWDDYPNKWQRQDLGTDLVFRDNEGLIWAVQAKCYGEHRRTTKGDMNSFLADTGRKEVDRRLWMQTTNKMEEKAEKTRKGQDKPVKIFTLNDFRDAPLEYPASFADLYQAKVKAKPTPDTHQIKAIEDATAGLKTSDRGQMIMACGTGKTFTTLWIKEALDAHTTLVLLPSLSLLSQTMREWAWAGNTDFDILNVCSDTTVGTKNKPEDMKVSDVSFPVTSKVEKIVEFLKQSKPKVVFCTYQSSDLIAQAQLDDAVPTFDLAVADEAHRCAGKADAGFATILDSEKIRASKRLFTTATPRYFGKTVKDAAKANDLAVVGMDDEAVFGPVIHKLTFGQAIEQELLTDYQVVIVGVDEPMVREWIENYEIVSTDPDNETDARTLAAKIGMLKAVKDYDLKRVISFHSRVAGAKQFSGELVDVANLIEPANRPEGTFLSDYVSGAMKAGDRKEKIDRLKVLEGYDRGILTNARCLAEGVDVPSLDGVAFIDPKGSQVEIIQAVGRAIRKVRGATVQKKGTIVLPVFIEDGDDHEASIEASNFKPVWDVLKALRSHDDDMASTLDQYRTNMAKNASQNRESISDRIVFDIPINLGSDFSANLKTILVRSTTEAWNYWFGLLEKFIAREGHTVVPIKHIESGSKLGQWVSQQRAKKDTLSLVRRERLDSLGFIWNTQTALWNEGFSHLEQFNKVEGHCKVAQSYTINSFNLGNWVATQRSNKNQLTNNQIELLEGINFIWDAQSENKNMAFGSLQKFYDREGHGLVPQHHLEEGFRLGQWVSTRRQKKSLLAKKDIDRLNSLGFVWDVAAKNWNDNFQKLQIFHSNNGHSRVPSNYKIDGYNLGAWTNQQRLKKNKLSEDQFKLLNSLDFTWSIIDSAWDEYFLKLKEYFKKNGHSLVPQGYKVDDFNLGNWVTRQRVQKKLPSRKTELLNTLDFVWDIPEFTWNRNLAALKVYLDREGDILVPTKHIENDIKLGNWVSSIRQKKGSLESEKLEKLNSLGFVWSPLNKKWEEAFNELKIYFDLHGNCKVPESYRPNNFTLSSWVGKQRSQKSLLSNEQISRLNELNFSWVINDPWEKSFNELKDYFKIHSNTSVPKGTKLYGWIVDQRAKQKKKKLSPDKIAKLEMLNFVWDPTQQHWNEMYDALVQFELINGHCMVPEKNRHNGFSLGTWVMRQRKLLAKLSQSQVDRLNSIGFVWDPYRQSWEEAFSHLKVYQKREGNCAVPQRHVENGYKLGQWVSNQRMKLNTYSPELKLKLDELGFVWDASKDKP